MVVLFSVKRKGKWLHGGTLADSLPINRFTLRTVFLVRVFYCLELTVRVTTFMLEK